MTEKKSASYLPLVAGALLLLTLLCRGMGYIYSTIATDLAYSELTVSIMGILVEMLTILRTITGFGAVLFAMARWDSDTPVKYRCGTSVFVLVLCMDALDYFSRYLVDSAMGSIVNMEKAAALWLVLQFVYSTLLITLCWGTGALLFHPKTGKPKSLDRVLTQSVLYLTVSRLLLELYYILDFVTTYADITFSEKSAMVGQVLYTLVLYGGFAWAVSMGIAAGLRGIYGVRKFAGTYGNSD